VIVEHGYLTGRQLRRWLQWLALPLERGERWRDPCFGDCWVAEKLWMLHEVVIALLRVATKNVLFCVSPRWIVRNERCALLVV
jgi:hypothetical protein